MMEMEIDLSKLKDASREVIVATFVATIIAIMLIGKMWTPHGNRLLTWQEWQIRKMERAERIERALLLGDAYQLASLLQSERPEPARAQVIVSGIQRHLSNGQPTLADERELLANASQAVLDWASGLGDYNKAVNAVQNAIEVLENGKFEDPNAG